MDGVSGFVAGVSVCRCACNGDEVGGWGWMVEKWCMQMLCL